MKGLKIFDLFKVYLKYIDQMPITNSNFLSQLTLRLKKPPEYRLSTIVSIIELRINYCSLLDVMRYVSCERRCVLFFRCSVGNDKMLKPKTSFLKILHLPRVNMRAGVTAFSALLIVGGDVSNQAAQSMKGS